MSSGDLTEEVVHAGLHRGVGDAGALRADVVREDDLAFVTRSGREAAGEEVGRPGNVRAAGRGRLGSFGAGALDLRLSSFGASRS